MLGSASRILVVGSLRLATCSTSIAASLLIANMSIGRSRLAHESSCIAEDLHQLNEKCDFDFII